MEGRKTAGHVSRNQQRMTGRDETLLLSLYAGGKEQERNTRQAKKNKRKIVSDAPLYFGQKIF
jgi:hypothetical protein